MTEDEERKLREAFFAWATGEPGKPDDPSPEQIWQAAAGELPPAQVCEILDQVPDSPACAVMWIVARRAMGAVDDFGVEERTPHREIIRLHEARFQARNLLPIASAIAALVAVAAGIWFAQRDTAPPPYRGEQEPRSGGMVEVTEVPRGNVVLRWEAGLEGVRYQLRVSRADLRPLFVVEELQETQYVISVEQLADVENGEIIEWQVRSMQRDGSEAILQPQRVRIIGPK